MTGVLIFLCGASLALFILYDFLHTALSLSGLGPVSTVVRRLAWRILSGLAVACERRLGIGVRQGIGPVILSLLAATWISGTFAGYFLMYSAGTSLEVTVTGEPASLTERAAFAGASLSTLGASVVSPTTGGWDILSMVAAVHGMIVLTLSVSFVTSVLSTTVKARVVALRVNVLTEMASLRDEVDPLSLLGSVAPQLCELAIALDAAPLPGYFVTRHRNRSFPDAVLRICDVLERAAPENRAAEVGQAQLEEALAILAGRKDVGDGLLEGARRWARQRRISPDG